jgi:hypothetical protein
VLGAQGLKPSSSPKQSEAFGLESPKDFAEEEGHNARTEAQRKSSLVSKARFSALQFHDTSYRDACHQRFLEYPTRFHFFDYRQKPFETKQDPEQQSMPPQAS